MATIIPFRGIRYNDLMVPNLAEVTTPPYDVISPEEQDRYYDRHPNNVIRLELGRKTQEDTPENNRYTRSAADFHQWLEAGVLQCETAPALYVYQQEFSVGPDSKTRTGLICGLQLEEYDRGIVLPHEETLPKHKADRLELMRACQANFSSIFGLYSDSTLVVDHLMAAQWQSRKPDSEFRDDNNITHRLWTITDPAAIGNVVNALAPHRIYIADGHHRYETALQYRNERRAQNNEHGADHVMVVMVNLYDPGLIVLPTHRMVSSLKDFDQRRLLAEVNEDFHVETLNLPGLTGEPSSREAACDDLLAQLETRGESGHALGFYCGGASAYLFTLRGTVDLDQLPAGSKSGAWRRLDVTILHNLILEKRLGIGSQQRADETNLVYTRDHRQAIEDVQRGTRQLAFLMNPPLVQEVIDVASAGDKMPQKSTYFYPKLITGLVINPLSSELVPQS
ncbi:MAG: DUF1015 domain-containing protein [Bacillota bacterium]